MLRNLIAILNGSSHVERDEHRADLVEQGEVVRYLTTQLVLELKDVELLGSDLEFVSVLASHRVVGLLIVDLELLEVSP